MWNESIYVKWCKPIIINKWTQSHILLTAMIKSKRHEIRWLWAEFGNINVWVRKLTSVTLSGWQKRATIKFPLTKSKQKSLEAIVWLPRVLTQCCSYRSKSDILKEKKFPNFWKGRFIIHIRIYKRNFWFGEISDFITKYIYQLSRVCYFREKLFQTDS